MSAERKLMKCKFVVVPMVAVMVLALVTSANADTLTSLLASLSSDNSTTGLSSSTLSQLLTGVSGTSGTSGTGSENSTKAAFKAKLQAFEMSFITFVMDLVFSRVEQAITTAVATPTPTPTP